MWYLVWARQRLPRLALREGGYLFLNAPPRMYDAVYGLRIAVYGGGVGGSLCRSLPPSRMELLLPFLDRRTACGRGLCWGWSRGEGRHHLDRHPNHEWSGTSMFYLDAVASHMYLPYLGRYRFVS